MPIKHIRTGQKSKVLLSVCTLDKYTCFENWFRGLKTKPFAVSPKIFAHTDFCCSVSCRRLIKGYQLSSSCRGIPCSFCVGFRFDELPGNIRFSLKADSLHRHHPWVFCRSSLALTPSWMTGADFPSTIFLFKTTPFLNKWEVPGANFSQHIVAECVGHLFLRHILQNLQIPNARHSQCQDLRWVPECFPQERFCFVNGQNLSIVRFCPDFVCKRKLFAPDLPLETSLDKTLH